MSSSQVTKVPTLPWCVPGASAVSLPVLVLEAQKHHSFSCRFRESSRSVSVLVRECRVTPQAQRCPLQGDREPGFQTPSSLVFQTLRAGHSFIPSYLRVLLGRCCAGSGLSVTRGQFPGSRSCTSGVGGGDERSSSDRSETEVSRRAAM